MAVPKHIGIIMDGNRRFAKRLMMKPWKGHEWGKEKLKEILTWCKEKDIRELTLYTFSIQNFNRPKEEFEYLMKIFAEGFQELINDERLVKDDIRINFIGRNYLFPKMVRDMQKKLMDMTKNHNKFVINFAMAYGGREEVIDAVRKIGEQVKTGELSVEEINEEVFSKNLYMEDEPDLIIRTGGEYRTSNFLIWQSSYAEWFFVDHMFPEFTKEDFEEAITSYVQRDRRFGK